MLKKFLQRWEFYLVFPFLFWKGKSGTDSALKEQPTSAGYIPFYSSVPLIKRIPSE